jgi:hypothetical protein
MPMVIFVKDASFYEQTLVKRIVFSISEYATRKLEGESLFRINAESQCYRETLKSVSDSHNIFHKDAF